MCVYVSACKCVSEYHSEDRWSRWSSSRWYYVMGPPQLSWALSCDVAWQQREFMCLTKTFNPLTNPLHTHTHVYRQSPFRKRLKTSSTTARGQIFIQTDRSYRLSSLRPSRWDYLCADAWRLSGDSGGIKLRNNCVRSDKTQDLGERWAATPELTDGKQR